MWKINIQSLDEKVEQGLLRKSVKDDLILYCYTPKCEYQKAWDEITTISRGLVVDHTGLLVCRTFQKFFNLNQVEETKLENLPKDLGYQVYEKIDGSFLQIFFHNGEWRMSTKGSLDNEYIDFAKLWAKNNLNLNLLPKEYVYACEVCMPSELDGMKRSVSHKPGIYYLSSFHVGSFREVEDDPFVGCEPLHIWKQLGGLTVKEFDNFNIDDYLKFAKEGQDTEGWVIRFQNGLRVKLKTFWYLKIFAFINNLNEKSIKEFMKTSGNVWDRSWLESFPEELLKEAVHVADKIEARFNKKKSQLEDLFNEKTHFLNLNSEGRKELALRLEGHPDKYFIFKMWDHKSIDEKLLGVI